MAVQNNIDILIEGQYHLNYENAESLGLQLSRKVDDFNDLSKRFGEYTYTFTVPQTKANNIIFSHANALHKQKIFVGQKFNCLILNNDQVLLDGILELVGIKSGNYEVVMHSKLNDFIDIVQDMTLPEITTFADMPFNYEQTIVDYLNANYQNSDEALFQFPFVFYNTVYCPYSVMAGLSDDRGRVFPNTGNDTYQNNYYAFNSTTTNNEYYYHQFPPALYLVRIIEGIFNTVGWQVGGSWLQRDEVKKIICPFIGDTDIYDRCLVTGTTPTLRPALFLPDMKMLDFLSAVINAFNLYFIVDAENKSITLESWQTMFGDGNNPYNLDNLIDASTIQLQKPDNANPTITFGDTKDNEFILGDNKVLKNISDNLEALQWQSISNKNYQSVFNKLGKDDEIKLDFGTPRVKRMFLWNNYDIQGNNDSYGKQTIFVPSISRQNTSDNGGKPFFKASGNTLIYNTEDTIQYNGELSMYYYYGQSSCDVVDKVGKNVSSDYMYLNIPTGLSYTIQRTKIGFASPFMLSQNMENVDYYLSGLSSGSTLQRALLTTTYIKTLYNQFKRSDNQIPNTPYSLVFDDDNSYHQSLYTYYHMDKYLRYQQSNILNADIVMNEDDWLAMPINRPLSYRGEIYSLVSLDFNPITRVGNISMIKQL